MLEELLAPAAVEATLQELAQRGATGSLVLHRDPDADVELFLRSGQVYAVAAARGDSALVRRLVASGALAPGALADVVEARSGELQGRRLSELLVQLGHVDEHAVTAATVEVLHDVVAELLRLAPSASTWRKGRRTAVDVVPPVPVEDLLAAVEERRRGWEDVLERLGPAQTVPALAPAPPRGVGLRPLCWSVLCRVDGRRTVADLARACGLTLHEGGRVLLELLEGGYVVVPAAAGSAAPARTPRSAESAEARAVRVEAERIAHEAGARIAAEQATRAPAESEPHVEGDPAAPAVATPQEPAQPDAVQPAAVQPDAAHAEPPRPEQTPPDVLQADREEPDPAPPAPASPHSPALADMADTAALLRELAGLGMDDDHRAAPPPAHPPLPSAPAGQTPAPGAGRRRKGLFGRG